MNGAQTSVLGRREVSDADLHLIVVICQEEVEAGRRDVRDREVTTFRFLRG